MRSIAFLILGLWAVACSSDTPESKSPAAPPAAAGGEELGGEAQPGQPEVEARAEQASAQEADPAIVAGQPAGLVIETSVAGEAVPAQVTVKNEAGETLASGQNGERLAVRSGNLTVEATIEDKSILFDTPTSVQEVTLPPGEDTNLEVAFPWSKVRLNVRINGKPTKKAKLSLSHYGENIGTLDATREYITVSPGRYSVEVQARGTVTTVEDVMFPEGAQRDIPLDVQL